MPTPLRRRSLLQTTGASLGALSLRGFAIDKPADAHTLPMALLVVTHWPIA